MVRATRASMASTVCGASWSSRGPGRGRARLGPFAAWSPSLLALAPAVAIRRCSGTGWVPSTSSSPAVRCASGGGSAADRRHARPGRGWYRQGPVVVAGLWRRRRCGGATQLARGARRQRIDPEPPTAASRPGRRPSRTRSRPGRRVPSRNGAVGLHRPSSTRAGSGGPSAASIISAAVQHSHVVTVLRHADTP